MKNTRWIHILIAAALVVAGGAVLALAETFELEFEDGEKVTVDVDGAVEVITLEDLYDGEERTIDAGTHEVTVSRDGDRLEVALDGQPIGGGSLDFSDAGRVFVMTDGDESHHDEKIIVSKKIREGEEAMQDIRVEVIGDEEMVWNTSHGESVVVRSGGGHPFVFHGTGEGAEDMVVYRCEDTGSTLVVDADRATADSYIDPATGCEMARIEAENMVIVKTVEIDED